MGEWNGLDVLILLVAQKTCRNCSARCRYVFHADPNLFSLGTFTGSSDNFFASKVSRCNSAENRMSFLCSFLWIHPLSGQLYFPTIFPKGARKSSESKPSTWPTGPPYEAILRTVHAQRQVPWTQITQLPCPALNWSKLWIHWWRTDIYNNIFWYYIYPWIKDWLRDWGSWTWRIFCWLATRVWPLLLVTVAPKLTWQRSGPLVKACATSFTSTIGVS